MKRLLFPPIVPNSLPAFSATENLKYYFKPSVANTIDSIQNVQVSIVRLDTNRSALPEASYPHELIIKSKTDIKFDSQKNFYYVEISEFKNLKLASDTVYKMQLRLGEANVVGMTPPQITAMLKDYDKLSEWSIVTMVMPITTPEFGIQGLSETDETKIFSTGYVFSGFYNPLDANRKETLRSYKYSIYSGIPTAPPSTWKLISTSGEKVVENSQKANLDFTFPVELKEEQSFIVTMTIKTKNLYTKTKVYKIKSATYPILEMFNSIDVEPNVEQGQMDVTIRAKQILMKPLSGSNVSYMIDDPGHEQYPNLVGTHAIIDGSIESSGDMLVHSKNGKVLAQFKVMFTESKKCLKEIIEDPYIEICQKKGLKSNASYYTKIKIGCMYIDLAYPTSGNLRPNPNFERRIIVRKEICSRKNGVEKIILSQNKVIRGSSLFTNEAGLLDPSIDPKQEFYFYVKENNGSLDVSVAKTYKSTK